MNGKDTVDVLDEERVIIDLLKETEVIRDKRKRTNLIGNYAMFRFLEELQHRKNIKPSVARKMFWFEFSEAVHFPDALIKRLAKRTFATVVTDGNQGYCVDYPAIVPSTIQEESTETDALRGIPAAKGKVKGTARIVLRSVDFQKFRAGEVLVASMTRPEYIAIMKQAKAIITDEGGLTCHAAIVARELGIPCIVGTKKATEILKDGDLVEVDAEKGIVRKI